MKKKMFSLLSWWNNHKKKQAQDNAIYEASIRIQYGDVDGVPYLFNNNIPMFRISSEPTDLLGQTVNIQDACKVITNLRSAFVLANIR